MTVSILIIDCTNTDYTDRDEAEKPLGGIQRCVIGLSRALSRYGYSVSVLNKTSIYQKSSNIEWFPIDHTPKLKKFDIVICCNDPELFDLYKKISGYKNFIPIIWFHNSVGLLKTIRKGRFWYLIKYLPNGVFLSENQKNRTSRLIPLKSRSIIYHGLDHIILSARKNSLVSQTTPPTCVYLSQPYRGLAEMISLWINFIHPAIPQAKFRILCNQYDPILQESFGKEINPSNFGIELMGRVPRNELINYLKDAHISLIPGHKDETFCLAAAESIALGTPVITYGHGSLKERVEHNVTGFIANNKQEFIEYIIKILGTNTGHQSLHLKTYQFAPVKSWDDAVLDWKNLFMK